MATGGSSQTQTPFEMRWMEMMHARMASFKHRMKPPVYFAKTIDDYDVSDVSLEETLAKSSGTAELLYLVSGQLISVCGPTGRMKDRVIVRQGEVPLDSTDYYHSSVAGCDAAVPMWRTRDVFDLTEEDLDTAISCQIRPAIYGYVPKPHLVPPSAARQKLHVVDSCFELRRGDYVKTVDGIERHIVTNDCQLMVLFDVNLCSFTYYKVAHVKTRQNRPIPADALAWWGRQMSTATPISPSTAPTDLLQDNWDRSGRSASRQFPHAPLSKSIPSTATNFPPLRHHGKPGAYSKTSATNLQRGVAPKASVAAGGGGSSCGGGGDGAASVTQLEPESDSHGAEEGGGGGGGDRREGGGGDRRQDGDGDRRQDGDGDRRQDGDGDQGDGGNDSDPDDERSTENEDEDNEDADSDSEVNTGDDGSQAGNGRTKRRSQKPPSSPVFTSPVKRRTGPLISLPQSGTAAAASPPLLAFPSADEGANGRLATPLQPTNANSERMTPPPSPHVSLPAPTAPTVAPQRCNCRCSSSTWGSHATKRITQQIANMGTNMQNYFDDKYGSLVRQLVPRSKSSVAVQTERAVRHKAVQVQARTHTVETQATPTAEVTAPVVVSKPPKRQIAAGGGADGGPASKAKRQAAETASSTTTSTTNVGGKRVAKGAGGKVAAKGDDTKDDAAVKDGGKAVQVTRKPPLKYTVMSQSSLAVRRWGGSLPTEYLFDDAYVVLRERHLVAAAAAAGKGPSRGDQAQQWAVHCGNFCAVMVKVVCEHETDGAAVFFPKPDSRRTTGMDELIDRQPAPLGALLREYVSRFVADGDVPAAVEGVRLYVDSQRRVYEDGLKKLEGCVKSKGLLDHWY